jgi:murein DD-endopeptidase MepM/ murein hydrolase activator NlpD
MTLVHSRRHAGRHRRQIVRPRRRTLVALLLAIGLVALPCLVAQAQPAGARPGDIEPRFDWPLVPDPPVTRNFEPPSHPYGPGHRGVDLGTEVGQSVLAAGAGTVLFAGTVAGRAVVSIAHDGGIRTTYEPLHPSGSTGDQIDRGQVIGEISAGHEACPAPACLHWGALRSEEYLNPLRLVRPDTMLRLKPWDAPE